MGQSEDRILWSEFRGGSHEAFSRIYTRFFPALYNYGIKLTPRPEVVEECVQQLFVELWLTREKLSSICSIKPYLYKSFRRKLLRQIKRDLSHRQLSAQPFAVEISREGEIISAEQSRHRVKVLDRALQKLSDRQREAIFLKFYDQLSYSEISKVLECEPKVAYDLVFKAIRKMRLVMAEKKLVLLSVAIGLLFLAGAAL